MLGVIFMFSKEVTEDDCQPAETCLHDNFGCLGYSYTQTVLTVTRQSAKILNSITLFLS